MTTTPRRIPTFAIVDFSPLFSVVRVVQHKT